MVISTNRNVTRKVKKTLISDDIDANFENKLLAGDPKTWQKHMATIKPPKWPPSRVIRPKTCVDNPNVDVYCAGPSPGNGIPFMSVWAACYLSSHGYPKSDDFKGIEIMVDYDSLLIQEPTLSLPFRQSILNGLRIGKEYAEGTKCEKCCEIEMLMDRFPGISSVGARLLIKAFGTADEVVAQVTMPLAGSIYGRDLAWKVFDEVFCRIDLSKRISPALRNIDVRGSF